MTDGVCEISIDVPGNRARHAWGILVRVGDVCVLVTAAVVCVDSQTGSLFHGSARVILSNGNAIPLPMGTTAEDVASGLALTVLADEPALLAAIPIERLDGPDVSVSSEAELPFERDGKRLQVKLTDRKSWTEVGVAAPLPEGIATPLHGVPLFKERWLIGVVHDGSDPSRMGVADGRVVAALVRQKRSDVLGIDRRLLSWTRDMAAGRVEWTQWLGALAFHDGEATEPSPSFDAAVERRPVRLLDLLEENWSRGFLGPLLSPLVLVAGIATVFAGGGLGLAAQICGIDSAAARMPALLLGTLLACVPVTALFVSTRGALVGSLLALASWTLALVFRPSCAEASREHSTVLAAISIAAFVASASMVAELRPAATRAGGCFAIVRRYLAWLTAAVAIPYAGWSVLQVDAIAHSGKAQGTVTAIAVLLAITPILVLTIRSPRFGFVRRLAGGDTRVVVKAYAACGVVGTAAAAYASFAVRVPVLDQFGVGLIAGAVSTLLLTWVWPLVRRLSQRWIFGAAPAALLSLLLGLGFAVHVGYRTNIVIAALVTTVAIDAGFYGARRMLRRTVSGSASHGAQKEIGDE